MIGARIYVSLLCALVVGAGLGGPGKSALAMTTVVPHALQENAHPGAQVMLAQAGPVPRQAPSAKGERLLNGEAEPAVENQQGKPPFADGGEEEDEMAAIKARLSELNKAGELAKAVSELRAELQSVQAENAELKRTLASVQTESADLKSAKASAERRASELNSSFEQASTEARRIDEELVAMRWENAQLNTSLERANSAKQEVLDDLESTRTTLKAQIDRLAPAAEEASTKIATLQLELDQSRQDVLAAATARAEKEAQYMELEQATVIRRDELETLKEELTSTSEALEQTTNNLKAARTTLDETEAALSTAQVDGQSLRAEIAERARQSETLLERVENTTDQLAKSRSANADLEKQMTALRTVAIEAAKAVRQNLVAAEGRIDEIDAMLIVAKDEGGSLTKNDGEDLAKDESGDLEDDVAPRTPAPVQQVALIDRGPAPRWIPQPPPARNQRDAVLVEATSRASNASPLPAPAVPTTADVGDGEAGDGQATAEALLAELKADEDDQGLRMTVPGASLFVVNSDAIEPSAHKTLAQIADLIKTYKEREVMILGFTDAVGDAAYNQQLSERRAGLVKAFFVENHGVDSERLVTRGLGEDRPIASNATLTGRQANRRVEVVILN